MFSLKRCIKQLIFSQFNLGLSTNYTKFLRNGGKIGENCEIFPNVEFGSEPYLITIGNNVRITNGVKFVTHDGGVWVLRNLGLKDIDCFGEIIIGDNVHIGWNAIIMPNVKIGDNCVIGAGAVVNGRMVQGLTHPEMGHIFLKRHKDDKFEGRCPFHKDCMEGMAAGPAIEDRWGKKGFELADRDEVWDMEAYYLAQAVVNYILILSPQKVIMGGGVMKQKQLFPLIRKYVSEFLNGYVQKEEILEKIDDFIVYPGLGDEAGFVGSIALGKVALENSKK